METVSLALVLWEIGNKVFLKPVTKGVFEEVLWRRAEVRREVVRVSWPVEVRRRRRRSACDESVGCEEGVLRARRARLGEHLRVDPEGHCRQDATEATLVRTGRHVETQPKLWRGRSQT